MNIVQEQKQFNKYVYSINLTIAMEHSDQLLLFQKWKYKSKFQCHIISQIITHIVEHRFPKLFSFPLPSLYKKQRSLYCGRKLFSLRKIEVSPPYYMPDNHSLDYSPAHSGIGSSTQGRKLHEQQFHHRVINVRTSKIWQQKDFLNMRITKS